MQRRLAGLTVLTVCLLLVPVPATAGGWAAWIDLDKELVATGERVTATATAMFSSIEQAQATAEHGGYHAYLVQGVDRERLDEVMTTAEPGAWWTVPPTTLHLAELEFTGTDANVAEVRATFTIPDVEPGLYGVMFCSEGCTEPLADIVPRLDIPLHDDPVLAHMVRSLETQDGGSRLSVIESRMDEVYESVGALRRQVRTALEEPAPAPTPTPEASPAAAPIELSRSTPAQDWLVVAGAFLAGATLAGLVLSLRQRRRRPPAPREPRVLVAEPDAEPLPEPMASAPR